MDLSKTVRRYLLREYLERTGALAKVHSKRKRQRKERPTAGARVVSRYVSEKVKSADVVINPVMHDTPAVP